MPIYEIDGFVIWANWNWARSEWEEDFSPTCYMYDMQNAVLLPAVAGQPINLLDDVGNAAVYGFAY